MKPKHEIKTEGSPDMVCVGFMATRNPDGSFNQSVPLYQAAEDGLEDDFDNLTWNQLIDLFDDMVRERAKVAEILETEKTPDNQA